MPFSISSLASWADNREVLVRDQVPCDRPTGGGHWRRFQVPTSVLADQGRDRRELAASAASRPRVLRPRAIIEGQHHLAGLQKIVLQNFSIKADRRWCRSRRCGTLQRHGLPLT
jgi:hypothetical protein